MQATKTKMQPAAKTTVSNNCNLSVTDITAKFVASQKKKEASKNYADDLANVCNALVSYYDRHTFSFNEFLTLSNWAENVPLPAKKDFFTGWIEAMKSGGKCRSVASIYEYQLFQLT